MAYRITKEFVCGGAIKDTTASLAETLRALSAGGLDLEMIVSRRDQSGWALMFVSPLRSEKEMEVAEAVGLRREGTLQTLRIEGPDAHGLGARIATALADAGIEVRGYWALSLSDRAVTDIAFDDEEDQECWNRCWGIEGAGGTSGPEPGRYVAEAGRAPR
ncbi:MAG: hypothetical protein PVJ57_17860 [Phycisphaerae bacterium]|jgi:hypothetical protein